MFNWIFFSLLCAIFISIWVILTKITLQYVNLPTLLLFGSAINYIISLFILKTKNMNIKIDLYAIIAGLFSGIAIYLLDKAVKLSLNPGLPDAIFSTQSIWTYIISLFIFGGHFNIIKLIGILLIISSIFIIQKNKLSTINWIPYALFAGAFATIQDIFKKYSLTYNNNNHLITLNNLILSRTFIYFLPYIFYSSTPIPSFHSIFFIFFTGLSKLLLEFFQLTAFKTAPNVGYVKSISSIAIIISTLVFEFMKHQTIHLSIWLALFINIIGICIIIFG